MWFQIKRFYQRLIGYYDEVPWSERVLHYNKGEEMFLYAGYSRYKLNTMCGLTSDCNKFSPFTNNLDLFKKRVDRCFACEKILNSPMYQLAQMDL